MTPVVVLFGAGAGIGLALIISGIWSSARPVRKATLTKRIDPANRQAAAAALIGAVIVGPGDALARRCGHRRCRRLDTALGTPTHHVAPGDRSARGPGHLDRGAA